MSAQQGGGGCKSCSLAVVAVQGLRPLRARHSPSAEVGEGSISGRVGSCIGWWGELGDEKSGDTATALGKSGRTEVCTAACCGWDFPSTAAHSLSPQHHGQGFRTFPIVEP